MISPLQRLLGLLIAALALGVGLAYAPDRPAQALVARWAPPPSDFIELDGQLVHLRDEGPRADPEPLLLLHGTGASLHTWEGWTAALRGQRRVVSVDLPGFGLTGPQPQADYRMQADVAFVLRLLDALKIRRCVLVGNSLGADIAWHTALAAPGRVARLVLVDAAGYPPAGGPGGWSRLPGFGVLAEHLAPRWAFERALQALYGEPSKVTPALVDRYLELMLREGNRAGLVQRLRQSRLGADASRIRELKLPTLVLWGGRDRLIAPADGGRFARDIAGSRVIVFPQLGHLPQEEDPAQTVQALKAFLAGA